MEEDPIVDTVFPHSHWGGTLPSPRSQKLGCQHQACMRNRPHHLSSESGRHASLVCDEPRISGHVLGWKTHASWSLQRLQHRRHAASYPGKPLPVPVYSARKPPLHAHFVTANFRTQLSYPLLQEAFLGSLVRIKCPSSVFQRPWSLTTEAVPPVGFLLNSALVRRGSGLPAANPRVQHRARHTVGTRYMFGLGKGPCKGHSRAFPKRPTLESVQHPPVGPWT